ncbi:hypothetical protein DTW94_03480 [Streptomyces cavourensis]|uniref:Uncharacterized protein n=1 Tax=Streptomyces cavourensis TaxID=67258 RepID=A0AAD0Q1N7_9ACTN|nr:hypothetical protein DTW94_03480 [Streptomyces cavourensis]
MTPAPDEGDRIGAASHRILTGCPERSNGALIIVALAVEAVVPRNALAQRHTGLNTSAAVRVLSWFFSGSGSGGRWLAVVVASGTSSVRVLEDRAGFWLGAGDVPGAGGSLPR